MANRGRCFGENFSHLIGCCKTIDKLSLTNEDSINQPDVVDQADILYQEILPEKGSIIPIDPPDQRNEVAQTNPVSDIEVAPSEDPWASTEELMSLTEASSYEDLYYNQKR